MEPAARARLVARYEEGPAVFEAALAAISPEELDFRSAPEEWTPREITHHTADSEMTAAIRLRRLLAEDVPVIGGYDEAEYARRLYYDRRPINSSLAALRVARETTVSILIHLGEDQWLRQGTHTETGPYGVETWLDVYAAHCHDHAAQVRRMREAFGQRPHDAVYI